MTDETKSNVWGMVVVMAIFVVAGSVYLYGLPDILKSKPKVADFSIRIEIWYGSDAERTEYFTCFITHNGSIRADDVRWRGRGYHEGVNERYDWIEPGETLSFSDGTFGEDMFGSTVIEWEYTDENDQTLLCYMDATFGRDGIDETHKSVEAKDE